MAENDEGFEDVEVDEDLDLRDDDGLVGGYDPDAPGDVEVRREMEDAWEDGRDASPVEGDSDAPELMDQEDPLRRDAERLGNEFGDLDNSGMNVEELTEADDDPEW